MKVGDKVGVRWLGEDGDGSWFPGVIKRIDYEFETVHVVFDDGDEDDALAWEHVTIP